MGFRVGCRIATTAVAGAGDGSTQHRAGVAFEASRAKMLDGLRNTACMDVGNEQVLPDGETNFSRAEFIGDGGNGVHLLRRQATDRHRDSDVVEIRLRLRMNANVTGAIDFVTRLAFLRAAVQEWKGQALFSFGEELVDAPEIYKVFEACLLAIGAVAVIDIDTDHGGRNGDGLLRPDQHASILRKLPMTGDSTQQDAKIDAGRHAASFADAYCLEANVVCVCQYTDGAAAVESDVEFARQFIEIARVEDVVVQAFSKRRHVDDLNWIDAGGGRGGDVADVVSAAAARG